MFGRRKRKGKNPNEAFKGKRVVKRGAMGTYVTKVRPAPAKPAAKTGGLLRQNLTIGPAVLSEVANPQVGGAIRNQAGTVSPFGNPLAPRPVPGLRREMEKTNRRVRQRFGAK
tara:strand:- start:9 stop:347 length:339 start_codon:yes stop_codon:yes gene_type:complete